VLTPTALVHAAAWAEMFDDFLRAADGPGFTPFEPGRDYDSYVDGKPRADGARDFLRSRHIDLPEGSDADPAGAQTVHALAARKDEFFLQRINRDGIKAYPGSLRYLREVRTAGLRTAVVSSSRNCAQITKAAGLDDLLDVRVDGVIAARGPPPRQSPGRTPSWRQPSSWTRDPPRPPCSRTPPAGVAAGRAGHFGYVVGVDPHRSRIRPPARRRPAVARSRYGRAGPDRTAGREKPVISHPAYPVEPWVVRETELDLNVLAQSESVFALSNGHIGLRGNLDEGEPHGIPGSYLNSVHEGAVGAIRREQLRRPGQRRDQSSTSPMAS